MLQSATDIVRNSLLETNNVLNSSVDDLHEERSFELGIIADGLSALVKSTIRIAICYPLMTLRHRYQIPLDIMVEQRKMDQVDFIIDK
ncbi:hypothetical protein O9G_000039 [Rozella allomycis CSF55]|uniref:Uncharacterized protein n=1 Tax=Rozella allomycis (strain CSF55) TaxID=988480 RepID=A0A075ASR1_ROZAC|nr:hypothetical protein O9G_000039 [Rozella allomycis CSF55]|eukprot:EPZ31563.1 hypothetical protein O9G_000039 [Rozella allomycis CSF55]